MCSLPGVILLLLTGAASAEEPRIWQSPVQLWLPPGATVELSCNISGSPWGANWYREKPDGSLEWIYQSTESSKPKGRYSGTVRAPGFFSFNISDVQREDSGSYYCTSSVSHSHFGDGTRLLVTDATEPKLSILVPVDAEEPSDVVPLLCHLHDLPRGWDTVRWHHGRDTPVTAEAVDERGVLGAWSLTWVSAERWDGAAACMATESGTGRNVSGAVSGTVSTAGCFLWLLAFVPPGAAVLGLIRWASRLRRRPARAVLRRGPETECEYAAVGH
ncbi:uncharacterized protein LOC118261146 [Cygnus atratus]|uniref:uncharacterized protein LOC118261146 n=1 Tax=Cygnus atratus TaxID=8868 RepID=UPI0015D57E14|nr:uncharacterized protein LOC118261146 [Cygnus atratus]